jgi:hypothetical protein
MTFRIKKDAQSTIEEKGDLATFRKIEEENATQIIK